MFPMTVTISNPAQLNAVMAALNVAGIESPKTSPCAGHAVETAKEEAKGKATTTKNFTSARWPGLDLPGTSCGCTLWPRLIQPR